MAGREYWQDQIKARAREMRMGGATVRAIALALDSNRTTISNLCWDIPHPNRRAAVIPKGKYTTCWQCGAALTESWRRGRFCPDCTFARYHRNGRAAAGNAVAGAIHAGILPSPSTLRCSDCPRPAEEYDHRDYSKPLDVQPVCRKCNARRGPGKWVQFKPVRELMAERRTAGAGVTT